MSFHKDLRGDDLHPPKIELILDSPIGSRTPQYVGETIVDTEAKAMYTATGLTVNDWELIGAAGAGLVVGAADDVDTTDRTDGTIIEWDATAEKYVHIATPTSIHNNLSGLNDGEYKHLATSEYSSLTGLGNASNLHIHDDLYYTETELDAGQLDNRYYTESEIDSRILSDLADVDTTDRTNESILEWDNASGTYIHIPDMQGKSAGLITPGVSVTDNGDGSITVSAGTAVLFQNENYAGKPAKYSFSGATFTLSNNTVNYIIVNYNSGSPILQSITDVDLINESSTIPVRTIYRNGTDLYGIDWDSLADGMSNKLHMRFVKTERFGWESGVGISESTGRVVNTTAGKVWYGAVRTDILEHSSDTNEWSFWYHSAGVWTEDKTTTTYNNTQYDDGTNLVTASNNNYLVNWVYRCSCNPAKGAYVLGNQQYSSIAAASESQPPELPPILVSVQFLVGRVIVEKNATSGIVESAFGKTFLASPVTVHNNLSGLNDGNFKHLTADEYTKIQTTYVNQTTDYTLTVNDFTVGAECSTTDLTMTLFSATDLPGKVVHIKKLDSTGYRVIVSPQAGETIDGDSEKVIQFQWTTLTLQSTGTDWIIL